MGCRGNGKAGQGFCRISWPPEPCVIVIETGCHPLVSRSVFLVLFAGQTRPWAFLNRHYFLKTVNGLTKPTACRNPMAHLQTGGQAEGAVQTPRGHRAPPAIFCSVSPAEDPPGMPRGPVSPAPVPLIQHPRGQVGVTRQSPGMHGAPLGPAGVQPASSRRWGVCCTCRQPRPRRKMKSRL